MELVSQFGFAILILVGIALATLIALLSYRLITLALQSRRATRSTSRAESRRDADARAEAHLVARLESSGFSPADARAAAAATRDD
ncbi:hypothetical protein [Herbiconiux solani]|uniref:hypothetical protein n=1 Tax=Herbiconiux solani TaxID=661329 RepID=UPI0008255146|nr:hypothetical protein [Herbiconiux solani]